MILSPHLVARPLIDPAESPRARARARSSRFCLLITQIDDNGNHIATELSFSIRRPSCAKPLKVDEVIAAAKRAKEAGSTRFCMGAAWRELGNKKKAFDNILEMVSRF